MNPFLEIENFQKSQKDFIENSYNDIERDFSLFKSITLNHINNSNEQNIKESILGINGLIYGDRRSLHYQIISDNIADIKFLAKEKGNKTVQDIATSVDKYMRASEKQAYVLAKFAHDNGLIEVWGDPKLKTKDDLPENAIIGKNVSI